MTLQQLRYLIAIAESGSINAAARASYVSQSNLSSSMKALEEELGIEVFVRTNRGITLTNEGTELLSYARQVIEQADMLLGHYAPHDTATRRLAISTQHYAFSVQAFIDIAESAREEDYEFALRECSTAQIIEDVRDFRSEIGILYLDEDNERVLRRAFEDAGLEFAELFRAHAHVFVGEDHPLAGRDLIEPEDLAGYPRYSFEQGRETSFYYSEEPLSSLPHRRTIRITDRGTLTNLLTSHDGYTLSTGVLSAEMHAGIVSIPLDVGETMRVGYLIHKARKPSDLLERYIERLKAIVRENPTVEA